MPLPPSDADSSPGPDGASAPLASETFAQLAIDPTPEEIFRCLGYPRQSTPPPATAGAVQQIVAGALPHLQPRGTYSLYALTAQTAHTLTIGRAVIHGHIGEYLHGAERIAVFLVTVGSEITREAATRRQTGDPFGGWVLDAVGSWAAEAAAGALLAQLDSHLGPDDGLTMRYSPGFCGMELAEQQTLFRLARAKSIGLALQPSLLMEPLKSISGIVGLGPRDAVGIALSPCDRCPLIGCHLRR